MRSVLLQSVSCGDFSSDVLFDADRQVQEPRSLIGAAFKAFAWQPGGISCLQRHEDAMSRNAEVSKYRSISCTNRVQGPACILHTVADSY